MHRLVDFRFCLEKRAVHVWPIHTQAPAPTVARLWTSLAPGEKQRAARFRSVPLQETFILARGALRTLMGRYLNSPAADIRLRYGSRGKPALAAETGLMFNASHSGALALFAFTLDCEIGIDIERIRTFPDMQQIANRYFCPEEAAELLTLPRKERETAFFLCWTRKEAYVKATGDGLSAPLDAFRVTVRPSDVAHFMRVPQEMGSVEAWTLEDLELGPDYAGALAYREKQRPLTLLPVVEVVDLIAMGTVSY